jgi:hypothetical protein
MEGREILGSDAGKEPLLERMLRLDVQVHGRSSAIRARGNVS